MIELLFLGSAAFAGGAHAVRQSRPRHPSQQRGQRRGPRDSLLVKAWNSAGAAHTNEPLLSGALADLGGRAIGKGARVFWERRNNPPVRPIPGNGAPGNGAPRFTASPGSAGPGGPARPAGAAGPGGPGKRPGDAPPLPGGKGSGPLPLPSGSHPAAPRSPIPMPSAQRRPGAPGGRGWSTSRRATGRGRGRVERARSRLRVAMPLNLDAPDTDVEFLEACADLQQMLRSIGVAVEDWNDELMTRRLPPIVTGPLETVHEGLVDGAACTALATALFENWFAEAREIAAAGIEFTGDDPE
ncbi:hypothetical protein [Actinomadura welshii]|uniref:hypothetical protein n=1 Tax=Actinomadura welshii TaxID=3103817 RepID=UPI0004632339|nr:hypothetical protein [Actinomadura madurae]